MSNSGLTLLVVNTPGTTGDRAAAATGSGAAVSVSGFKPGTRTIRFGLTAGDITTRVEIQASNDGTTWQSIAAYAASAKDPSPGIQLGNDNSLFYRTLRVAGTTATVCAVTGEDVDTAENVQFNFAAAASLTNAAAQWVPPSALATTLAATTGNLVAGARTVRRAVLQFTGDAANVAGQTITCEIRRNGVAIGDPVGPLATTAGDKATSVTFSDPEALGTGDKLEAVITPSAALTAVVTKVMIAVGS